MIPRIHQHATARSDLIGHFVYLTEHAGGAVADRFLDNAEKSFNLLLAQPMIGKPLVSRSAELAGLRRWSVKDFENFLIFYRPHADGIAVVRVLYAASDWWSILGLGRG